METSNPASEVPFFLNPVSAGFPSPADDFQEGQTSLDKLLIRHPAATFFVRCTGDSMKDVGIFSGDILIVDRAEPARHGAIVVAVVNGELLVKRLRKEGESLFLDAANPKYPPLQIQGDIDFAFWGVVKHSVRDHG